MKRNYQPVTVTVIELLSYDVITASNEKMNFAVDWLEPFSD